MSLVEHSPISEEAVHELIASVKWYHSVELLPNVIAPGKVPSGSRYPVESIIQFIENCAGDMHNKTILEIGSWDGPVAYKLRSLGYDVQATDIQNPDLTGFNVTGKITGLNVPYTRCNVYELPRYFSQEFDIILFFGVFYHLKYPILAFERIAEILKPEGRLLFMGSGVGNDFETLESGAIDDAKAQEFGAVLEEMDRLRIPVCLSYPGTYKKSNNWFLPNRTALDGWLQAAGFSIGLLHPRYINPNKILTLSGWAKKTSNQVAIEHTLVGEEGGFKSSLPDKDKFELVRDNETGK